MTEQRTVADTITELQKLQSILRTSITHGVACRELTQRQIGALGYALTLLQETPVTQAGADDLAEPPCDKPDACIGCLDGINAETQDRILAALYEHTGAPKGRIDGSGCDSGDPVDLTLSEISQAFLYLEDKGEESAPSVTVEQARRNVLARMSNPVSAVRDGDEAAVDALILAAQQPQQVEQDKDKAFACSDHPTPSLSCLQVSIPSSPSVAEARSELDSAISTLANAYSSGSVADRDAAESSLQAAIATYEAAIRAECEVELARASRAHVGALETSQANWALASQQEARAEKAESQLDQCATWLTEARAQLAECAQARETLINGVEQRFAALIASSTTGLEHYAQKIAKQALRKALPLRNEDAYE